MMLMPPGQPQPEFTGNLGRHKPADKPREHQCGLPRQRFIRQWTVWRCICGRAWRLERVMSYSKDRKKLDPPEVTGELPSAIITMIEMGPVKEWLRFAEMDSSTRKVRDGRIQPPQGPAPGHNQGRRYSSG